jgi:putative transcriptional regulator
MKTTKTGSVATRRRAGRAAAGGTRRRGSAGSKILEAIEEATEVLREEGLGSGRLTVRTYKVIPALRAYRPEDIKRVRDLLGASQAVLAQLLGVNVNTVRSWEQGKRPPQPIARRFLAEIESRPGYWRQWLGRSEEGLKAGNAPTG